MSGRDDRSRSPRRRPLGRLAGTKALVTGGGSGIGQAIALAFAREGAQVVVCGRREGALKETVSKAKGTSGNVMALPCDQVSAEAAAATVKAAHEHLHSIDVLVNAAGRNVPQRALEVLSPEDWHGLIDTNLNGAFHICHSVLPLMRAQQRGTVINISSIAGRRALPLSGAAYACSKFGMNALGDIINLEESKHGIRCTNICPGEVETEILNKRPVPPTAEHRAKMIKPEDVAEMVLAVAMLPQRCFVPEITITGASTIDVAV